MISIEPIAYHKLILHAAKYPDREVFGVLIGPLELNGSEDDIQITDSIPCFHSQFQPCAISKAALKIINFSNEKTRMKILGFYYVKTTWSHS